MGQEMKKRFTDADKWDDEWFRDLSPKGKVAWEFLRDRCDLAGFWKRDFKLMNFLTNDVYDPEETLKEINKGKKRVRDHGSYWEIVDFIQFQYGELTQNCRPHRAVFQLLEKYRKKGYQKGIDRDKDKTRQRQDKTGGGAPPPKEWQDLKKKIGKNVIV
jgi:hypothetical protein